MAEKDHRRIADYIYRGARCYDAMRDVTMRCAMRGAMLRYDARCYDAMPDAMRDANIAS